LSNAFGLTARKAACRHLPSLSLSPQAEPGYERSVTLDVLITQVAKQPPPFADHHQKASPTVVILLVGPQVLGEVVDALGEQRNLNLGRTRVLGVRTELFYYCRRVFHVKGFLRNGLKKRRTTVRV
jgi:hypothetical protein